jgi:acyl-CoA synthetase (AMP-forming)/AMP-acid ligase II/NAD(P)-dependent dehydrogenase (short-subunit alcohol dehydrogenase family)
VIIQPADEWPKQSLFTRFASRLLNPRGAPSVARLRKVVEGKTALITGASFGIGEACARLLASAGAKVLLAARSQNELDAIANSIRVAGGSAEVHPVDLTDTDAVAMLAEKLLAAHGSIDIVVSNAGKSIRRSIALSYDRFHDIERTLGVNYRGPVRLLLALLPEMRRKKSGVVVNVSTFGVRVTPGPRWGAYQASKAAFDTWFHSMGIEVRSDGVATSTIYLPLVYTRMSAPTPSLRGMPGMYPDQAAGLIAKAIVRGNRSISPWWLWPAEIASVIFRRPIEWALGFFFRRSTDSPRAMGKFEEPVRKKSPSLRRAFRTAGLLPRRPSTLIRMARAVLVQGGRPSSLCSLNAKLTPARTAVIDADGEVTYSELQRRSGRMAKALHDRIGNGPGKGVGIMCRNHRAFVEALLAVSATGADVILINTEFPGPQLAQVLMTHTLECLIHDAEFAEVIARSGCVAETIGIGTTVENLIASASGLLRSVRHKGKIEILTSGTTGVPKGAARTPKIRAVSGPLTTILTRVPFRAGGVILIAPPLFHGMGLAYFNLALLLGATVVVRNRFDPGAMLADIARHRVAVVIAVPSMLKRLLDVPEEIRSRHDLTSLKAVLSSGSALGVELGERFQRAFGPCLYNLYGSSESGFGAIATPDDWRAAPGTVGYPPVGTEIRILDPQGMPLQYGQVGRVFLKSGMAFGGYTGGGNKEIIDGYLNSGDLGHLDAKARLFIDGRADDMIISGGENVFPQEVEEALASHSGVAEVAVIGVPDDQFGQRLKAFVVAREGVLLGEEALKEHLTERVARFKIPREFAFVKSLPRNALGKVMKGELERTLLSR